LAHRVICLRHRRPCYSRGINNTVIVSHSSNPRGLPDLQSFSRSHYYAFQAFGRIQRPSCLKLAPAIRSNSLQADISRAFIRRRETEKCSETRVVSFGIVSPRCLYLSLLPSFPSISVIRLRYFRTASMD